MFFKDIALKSDVINHGNPLYHVYMLFSDTDHWKFSCVSGQLVSPSSRHRQRWARSTVHRAPTFLCTPINTEAVGEGETKAASWTKCQSTLIGSPSSSLACSLGRGEQELGSDGRPWWCSVGNWGTLAQLQLLSVFVWENGIPDLINTSIRCDCINTRLIKAGSGL